MKIRIENDDKIFNKDNRIEVYAQNEKYSFDSSEIEEIHIITTDMGPFYDDMCLAIRFRREEDVVVFMMSEHPLYRHFLFDELKHIVSLNFQAIIDASACTENKLFLIYKRGQGMGDLRGDGND